MTWNHSLNVIFRCLCDYFNWTWGLLAFHFPVKMPFIVKGSWTWPFCVSLLCSCSLCVQLLLGKDAAFLRECSCSTFLWIKKWATCKRSFWSLNYGKTGVPRDAAFSSDSSDLSFCLFFSPRFHRLLPASSHFVFSYFPCLCWSMPPLLHASINENHPPCSWSLQSDIFSIWFIFYSVESMSAAIVHWCFHSFMRSEIHPLTSTHVFLSQASL